MATPADNCCVVILGGSFDPVHSGHIAITESINSLLKPTQLRIIPTGRPKLKDACHASGAHRLAMLALAFQDLARRTPLVIDQQELQRAEHGIASYTIDTLSNVRFEFGAEASLVFIIGTDQLQQLQHWKNWDHLLDLAHIVVVSRPGFELDSVDDQVAYVFQQHAGSVATLRNRPFGHTYFYSELQIDISSTHIREELQRSSGNGNKLSSVPVDVLDYIQQHHLY